MAHRLCIGDAVLVCISNDDNNNDNNSQKSDSTEDNIQIGVIKYMGYIHGYSMSEYVGIELVESIDNGHNGTIKGYQYFNCCEGHGIYTRITNVIRKLAASEIAYKMQEILTLFKTRLNQYVLALSERDEYIEKLKSKQRYLRQLLNESKTLKNHLKINYHRESTKNNINTLRTDSPSFSSVDSLQKLSPSPVGIILFNPQKQEKNNNKLLPTPIGSKTVSNTSQFRGFVLSPITPITLSPNSIDNRTESTCSPTPRTSNATIIHHGVITKRGYNGKNQSFMIKNPRKSSQIIKTIKNKNKNRNKNRRKTEDKINEFPAMEILDSYYEDNKKYAEENNITITSNGSFPDIEMINLCNSSASKQQQNSFLLPPISSSNKYSNKYWNKSNKYKSPSVVPTEESLSRASYYHFDGDSDNDDDGYDVESDDNKYNMDKSNNLFFVHSNKWSDIDDDNIYDDDEEEDNNNNNNKFLFDELHDEYQDNSSLEEDNNNNNNKNIERPSLFSSYSTQKSMSNESEKLRDRNSNNNNKEKKCKSVKIIKSKSVSPPNGSSYNIDSIPLYIPCNPPQQQYAYSHITLQQIEKNRSNNINNIHYNSIQRQLFKAAVFIQPSISQSRSNIINSHHNNNKNINEKFVHKIPESHNYNMSKRRKPQYLRRNNQSVFVENNANIAQQQNIWIHPQQQQQTYLRQYNHTNHTYYDYVQHQMEQQHVQKKYYHN